MQIRTKRTIRLIIYALCGLFTGLAPALSTHAQEADHGIAAFSVWQPKDGQDEQFEQGYKEHLQWHQRSGDTWDWYGWYIISGPRTGWFMDATFGHSWVDYSHSVDPAGDEADNKKHTEPFGNYQGNFKVSRIDEASTTDTAGLRTPYCRMITLRTYETNNVRKLLAKLRDRYVKNYGIQNFQAYQVVEGGDLHEYVLLIGLPAWADWTKTAGFTDDLQKAMALTYSSPVLIEVPRSELLAYNAGMCLIHR